MADHTSIVLVSEGGQTQPARHRAAHLVLENPLAVRATTHSRRL